jgi:Ran GTPase-activating protein (RanGAP) involved in mRNA processing and transport
MDRLDLTWALLMSPGAACLGQGFRHGFGRRLRELCMGSNYIQADGAIELAAALPDLPMLTSLDLSNNFLCAINHLGSGVYRGDGLSALCSAVKELPCMQTLDLSTNYIKPDGVSVVAETLRACRSLTDLSLSNNQVCGKQRYDCSGVAELLSAMKHSEARTTLTKLDLSSNNITDYGQHAACFRQICAAMQGTAVIDLDLKDNFVSTSEKAFVQRTYQLRMMTLQV